MSLRTLTFPLAAILTALATLLPLTGCDLLDSESDVADTETIYPMYADENGNDLNDFVEKQTHEPGSTAGQGISERGWTLLDGPAPPGHSFVDENGDGICDFAQNGSASWHGPGYVDENGNGRYDHWEPGGRGHGEPHAGSRRMGGMNGSVRQSLFTR